MASVGQELLDVPFPDMVAKMAVGIASGQASLDKNSVETANILASTSINIIPRITQTIAADGAVRFENAPAIPVSLLQAGLNPAFYQFSKSTIEVSMDIKTTTSTETGIKVGAEAKVGFAVWSASVRVDVSHNRKVGREVHGTSKLYTELTPVPPPPRMFPEVTVVDNRPPQPPTPVPPVEPPEQ